MPSNTIEIISKLLFHFTWEFLSIFFPHTDDIVLEEIAENVNLIILGLGFAINGCDQYENLLELWGKSFFFINSEKVRNYYRSTFPDVESIGSTHPEVGLIS